MNQGFLRIYANNLNQQVSRVYKELGTGLLRKQTANQHFEVSTVQSDTHTNNQNSEATVLRKDNLLYYHYGLQSVTVYDAFHI